MKTSKWIIKKGLKFKGYTQSFMIENKVAYSGGLTFPEYNKKHDYKFKLITDRELDNLLEVYTNGLVSDWVEISESRYYEMLEVLPPVYRGMFFFSSEATYSVVHSCFLKLNGKFYESSQKITSNESELMNSFVNQKLIKKFK